MPQIELDDEAKSLIRFLVSEKGMQVRTVTNIFQCSKADVLAALEERNSCKPLQGAVGNRCSCETSKRLEAEGRGSRRDDPRPSSSRKQARPVPKGKAQAPKKISREQPKRRRRSIPPTGAVSYSEAMAERERAVRAPAKVGRQIKELAWQIGVMPYRMTQEHQDHVRAQAHAKRRKRKRELTPEQILNEAEQIREFLSKKGVTKCPGAAAMGAGGISRQADIGSRRRGG